MRMPRLSIGLAALSLGLLLAGCAGEEPGESVDDRLAKLDALVPVMGTVKVGGKPLAGVVVTFVPKGWGTAHGETDDEGKFTLETGGRAGAIPGEYRVVLSYLVTPDGRSLGLGARGGFTPNPDLPTAKEKLAPAVSSLENSGLAAVVPESGTDALVFDVGGLIEPAPATPESEKPAAETPAEAPAEKPAAPAEKPAEAPKG